MINGVPEISCCQLFVLFSESTFLRLGSEFYSQKFSSYFINFYYFKKVYNIYIYTYTSYIYICVSVRNVLERISETLYFHKLMNCMLCYTGLKDGGMSEKCSRDGNPY